MKRLIPVFVVILATLGACSHQDAVRPDAPGDVIFNMSGGGVAPAGNGAAANPNAALLEQQLANAEARLAEKQRALDELAAQLQEALAIANPKNEDVDAIKHGLEVAQRENNEAQLEIDRLKAELAALHERFNEPKPAEEDRLGNLDVNCLVAWTEMQQSIIQSLAQKQAEKQAAEAELARLQATHGQIDPVKGTVIDNRRGITQQQERLNGVHEENRSETAGLNQEIATLQDQKVCVDAIVAAPQCPEANADPNAELIRLCQAVGHPLGQ